MKKNVYSGIVCFVDKFHLSVEVNYSCFHKLYRKCLKRQRKYRVRRSNDDIYRIGDKVNFMCCRPISKSVCAIVV